MFVLFATLSVLVIIFGIMKCVVKTMSRSNSSFKRFWTIRAIGTIVHSSASGPFEPLVKYWTYFVDRNSRNVFCDVGKTQL
uniref:Sulfotransfer_1 domain-containing protein n=1 Tax=Steinernema glaseri TaxID=37863 RepID=A0A1I7ZDI9_9BILA